MCPARGVVFHCLRCAHALLLPFGMDSVEDDWADAHATLLPWLWISVVMGLISVVDDGSDSLCERGVVHHLNMPSL